MAQLLQNAVYGTALILAAAALRLVLKGRLIPEARLCLWAVCLFRLLTPAAPESVLSLWGLFAKPAPAPSPTQIPQSYAPVPSLSVTAQPTQAPQLYIPAAGGEAYVPAPPAEPAGAAFPWKAALIGLWLAVGIALTVWYAVSWNRTRRAVARAALMGGDDPRYTLLPKCARLREGPMEGAPLTFGAVKPTVVLSPGLGGDTLDCVLAHEGVHARRRDNLWHYAMALALAVHWWNPAVWLMARLLRRDIELSCDRAALKRLGAGRRADYANTLVTLATQGEAPLFSHTFGQKMTEERIIAIMKYKKTTALGLALSILLACGVTVAFATEPAEPKPNSEPDPEPTVTVSVQDCFDSVPGLTEEDLERLVPLLEEVRMASPAYFELTGGHVILGDLEQRAAQSDCKHPNLMQGKTSKQTFCTDDGASGHIRIELTFHTCPDCNVTISDDNGLSKFSEPHSFGAGHYVSSNHSAANPKLHFATYTHTCSACNGPYSYTSSTGCTQYGCVDVQSLTPEPEENSAADGELKAALEAQWKEHLEAQILEYLNSSSATGPVPSAGPEPTTAQPLGSVAPSASCGVEGCTETRYHAHNEGRTILLSDPCPVEGCTITGNHIHGDVCYSCNGAGHDGGVCDGSCYTYN